MATPHAFRRGTTPLTPMQRTAQMITDAATMQQNACWYIAHAISRAAEYATAPDAAFDRKSIYHEAYLMRGRKED